MISEGRELKIILKIDIAESTFIFA